jgi:serine/threonine-protein kinase
LKPPNIMREAKTGRIVVMDFGIARSMESEGMTQTGALIGTIEYMSPNSPWGRHSTSVPIFFRRTDLL